MFAETPQTRDHTAFSGADLPLPLAFLSCGFGFGSARTLALSNRALAEQRQRVEC